MKKLIYVSLGALVAMSVIGAGLAIAHSKKYETTTSIKFVGSSYGDSFNGKVKSEKGACIDKRKVVVVRNRDDFKVGEDTTGDDGKWEIELQAFADTGTYHAEVKKRTLKKDKKHSHICKATDSGNAQVGAGA